MVATSPVSKLLRPQNLTVYLGDSRKAQMHLDSFQLNISNANHGSWGNCLSGWRWVKGWNYGVSGDRSDQVLARLDVAIATGAGNMYLQVGANDIGQNYPTATTSAITCFNNIKTMADKALLNGMKVIIDLEAGATAFTAVQIAQTVELNERLRAYAEVTPNIFLLDIPSVVWDPVNTTISAIVFKANYFRDTTHLAAPGAYAVGKELAKIIQIVSPPLPRSIASMAEVPNANSLVNLLSNPMFTTTTGGIVQTGITGTMPASWGIQRDSGGGTQTATVSTAAASDGTAGNELTINCTFAAAGDAFRVYQDITLANWSPGDILQAQADISADAGPIAQIYQYLTANGNDGAAISATTMSMVGISNAQITTEALKHSLITEKMTIPPMTVSKGFATMYLRIFGSAAGSATVRLRKVQVKKRLS
jgi:lysophospholipase L1-like esterase